MSRPLASIAYHEAGHAVVMLGLGFPVASVSIVPEADTLGRVVPAVPPPAAAPEPPLTTTQLALVHMAAAITFVAGAEAERLAGYVPAGCESDVESADGVEDRVWDLTGVEPWRWRHIARHEAERYLVANWQAVERLAAALLVERALSGERAREVAGALPVPDLRSIEGSLDFWSRRASARLRTTAEAMALRSAAARTCGLVDTK